MLVLVGGWVAVVLGAVVDLLLGEGVLSAVPRPPRPRPRPRAAVALLRVAPPATCHTQCNLRYVMKLDRLATSEFIMEPVKKFQKL